MYCRCLNTGDRRFNSCSGYTYLYFGKYSFPVRVSKLVGLPLPLKTRYVVSSDCWHRIVIVTFSRFILCANPQWNGLEVLASTLLLRGGKCLFPATACYSLIYKNKNSNNNYNKTLLFTKQSKQTGVKLYVDKAYKKD